MVAGVLRGKLLFQKLRDISTEVLHHLLQIEWYNEVRKLVIREQFVTGGFVLLDVVLVLLQNCENPRHEVVDVILFHQFSDLCLRQQFLVVGRVELVPLSRICAVLASKDEVQPLQKQQLV